MKIAAATYSFRNLIRDGWTLEDVAGYLNDLGIKFVEINNFATSAGKLAHDASMFKQKGITAVLLTFDGNNFYQKAGQARDEQFELMKPWLDAAQAAGIKIVRANFGRVTGFLNTPAKAFNDLVATFKPILEHAEALGITFVFENHGRASSDLDYQVKFKQQFPGDKMGYLLDTGNYKPKPVVYDAIPRLGKAIKIVHAKMYEFGENGEETQLDFKRIISLLNAEGFDGYYSIEYEGSLPDKEGVQKGLKLLMKHA